MRRRFLFGLLAVVPTDAFLNPLPRRLEAVVLDADGTFLNPLHQVTEANAAAIREARAAGLKVFLATGRARSGPWVDECLEPLELSSPGMWTGILTCAQPSCTAH